jgi:hypothetical protein
MFKFTIAVLILLTIPGCSLFGGTTWEYTIPNDYEGWLAIQYDCPGGQPLGREGSTIHLTFGEDGLFCTSDSQFAWYGRQVVRDANGARIPLDIFGTQTGYGVCCSTTFGTGTAEIGPTGNSRSEEVTLDLLWVGDLQDKPTMPPFDAIHDDLASGTLVPAEW